LDRRHRTAVGVLLGILSELCVNGVLARGNGILAHLLAKLAEVVVDLLDNYFRIFAAKKEVEQFSVTVLALQKACAGGETYVDVSFERAQYSLRLMSRPLTSSFSMYLPSTGTMLIAAYFFFACRRMRRNTLSMSISNNL